MKYAVLASGGKQYKVSEGDIIEVEKLKAETGSNVVFDQILLLVEDGNVKLGKPNISGLTINAKIIDQIKTKKIRVAKFKAKSRYRKVYGHRQELTRVQIQTIGKSTSKAEEKSDNAPEIKTQKSSIRQAQDKKVKTTSKK